MRQLLGPFFAVAFVLAACGGAGDDVDDDAADTPLPTSTTLSSKDVEFNEEVADRFNIGQVLPMNMGSETETGFITEFDEKFTPAEAASLFICGDDLPDGWVLGYERTDETREIPRAEFEEYARSVYCP